MQIAVFASGNGSNFEALVKATKENEIKSKIKILIVDKPNAYVIERAKKLGIKYCVIELSEYKCKEKYEEAIIEILNENKIDLVCLAGYMKIVDYTLLISYENKIINIHPSLLPKFKGKDGFKLSVESEDKLIGATVHYVNSELDGGKIIDQISFSKENKTFEELEKELHEKEHILYVRAIKKLEEL